MLEGLSVRNQFSCGQIYRHTHTHTHTHTQDNWWKAHLWGKISCGQTYSHAQRTTFKTYLTRKSCCVQIDWHPDNMPPPRGSIKSYEKETGPILESDGGPWDLEGAPCIHISFIIDPLRALASGRARYFWAEGGAAFLAGAFAEAWKWKYMNVELAGLWAAARHFWNISYV